MSDYIRPHICQVEFRNIEGNTIDYGNRWASLGGPPEGSYSVIDHPERFAPLHTVAEGLIDYLVANYAVDVEEGLQVTADLMNPPKADEIVRAVRIAPKSYESASIVFTLTNHPSVRLNAGICFAGYYPSCGCNACDEEWESSADELEWEALSIASGGLAERVSKPGRPKWSFDRGRGLTQGMGQTVSFKLCSRDGESETGGDSRAEDLPAALLDEARSRLDAVASVSSDGNWQPWPLRSE